MRLYLLALPVWLALCVNQTAAAREAQIRAWPGAQPTPTLQLSDLDGKVWKLADLRGKVVLINFWASWCESCVEELPFLNELAQAEAGKLHILGVNFKESAAQVRQFPAARALSFPILLDRSGEDFRKWSGGILPTTILIDRKGKARWRIVGALDTEDSNFSQTLTRLLKE